MYYITRYRPPGEIPGNGTDDDGNGFVDYGDYELLTALIDERESVRERIGYKVGDLDINGDNRLSEADAELLHEFLVMNSRALVFELLRGGVEEPEDRGELREVISEVTETDQAALWNAMELVFLVSLSEGILPSGSLYDLDHDNDGEIDADIIDRVDRDGDGSLDDDYSINLRVAGDFFADGASNNKHFGDYDINLDGVTNLLDILIAMDVYVQVQLGRWRARGLTKRLIADSADIRAEVNIDSRKISISGRTEDGERVDINTVISRVPLYVRLALLYSKLG